MNPPVKLFLVSSCVRPTATGSYTFEGIYKIVVENLSYRKNVTVRGQVGNTWKDFPAIYSKSLPNNLELWEVYIYDFVEMFVVKYIVNNKIYWGKQFGRNNYNVPFPHNTNLFIGDNYKVVMKEAYYIKSKLIITIYLQDIAYEKEVGIVFTTDNWISKTNIIAQYNRKAENGTEVWTIEKNIGQIKEVEFAVFYRVNGEEYWDNNFNKNYLVTPTRNAEWGDG